MKVTKVVFKNKDNKYMQALATCDIVLDDKLKLVSIRLYRKRGKYYLVFPSKQDLYQEIKELNQGKDLVLPEYTGVSKKKNYEEFFFPMDYAFYGEVLSSVVEGYKIYRKREMGVNDSYSYIPKE